MERRRQYVSDKTEPAWGICESESSSKIGRPPNPNKGFQINNPN